MEKQSPLVLPASTTPTSRRRRPALCLLLAAVLLFAISRHSSLFGLGPPRCGTDTGRPDSEGWCPLPDVVVPGDDGLELSVHLASAEQLDLQVQRLSRAVQVPTESYDDNGEIGEDPRWETFGRFHKVLEELFPLVHAHLKLHKVNTYGLLYTWQGSVPEFKPLLLMAHQDVVPAGPAERWTNPPYAGRFDGAFLWGRGAADCKNVLVGLLSVAEDLLAQGFAPRRTVLFSFGFDEEAGGLRGARELSAALAEEWGSAADGKGVLLAMDEGGMGAGPLAGDDSGLIYAYPGVGEKGYHDVELTLTVAGGHSSRPPPHTAVGIMAEAVVALEAAPYTPRLPHSSPFRRALECRAKHSPSAVPGWLRDGLLNGGEKEVARRLVESDDEGEEAWLVQTSQAVDVINGGIKVNALPEAVRLLVNHRVALHESAGFVNEHVAEVLEPVVRKFRLGLGGLLGNASEEGDNPRILSMEGVQTLDPAPTSPTDNGVWAVFSGTLRHVLESDNATATAVPVGSIMTGNTDTTHYWDLTANIYRYTPARDGTRLNTHAVDERMEMGAHVEGMRVYYDLIRNFDKWDEE